MPVTTSPTAALSDAGVLECLLGAINKLDLGILLVGSEGRIAFANHAAQTLLRLRKGSRSGSRPTGHSRDITATLDRQLQAVIRRGRNRTLRHVERHAEPHASLTTSEG